MTARQALFLDRDGVINYNHGYVHKIEDFEWIPGIFETVRTANAFGCSVIVITNQAGIARGYYTEREFRSLTEWMVNQFAMEEAYISDVCFCPYHPDGLSPYNVDSPYRKPNPGMLFDAAIKHNVELGQSVLIGDQETDIAAGRAAGLRLTGLLNPDSMLVPTEADMILRSHEEACIWLRRVFGSALLI